MLKSHFYVNKEVGVIANGTFASLHAPMDGYDMLIQVPFS